MHTVISTPYGQKSLNPVDMNRLGGLKPKVFTFVKLSIGRTISGNTIRVEPEYTAMCRKVISDFRDFDGMLLNFINNHADSSEFPWQAPTWEGHSDSKLNQLSLRNEQLECLVFLIDSSDVKFPEAHLPFRAERGGQGTLRAATRIAKDSEEKLIKNDDASVLKDCEIAYFVSKGHNGNSSNRNKTSFNIYVDIGLQLDVVLPGGGGADGAIIVEIDPDVGHPGGGHP